MGKKNTCNILVGNSDLLRLREDINIDEKAIIK
jgi:hypothetical protein